MGSRRARRQLATIYISIAEEAQAERGKGRLDRPVPERTWAGQTSVGVPGTEALGEVAPSAALSVPLARGSNPRSPPGRNLKPLKDPAQTRPHLRGCEDRGI